MINENELIIKDINVAEFIANKIVDVDYRHLFEYDWSLTVCMITIENGFVVTGKTTCKNIEIYNKEIGEKLAYNKARDKIKMIEDYILKEKLYQLK
jgi:hypothetical protein